MRRIAISLAAVLIAGSCSTGSDPVARGFEPLGKRAAERPVSPRFDEPDAAEAYARAKRLGGSGINDPRAAWDRAVARRDAMAGYSIASDRQDVAAKSSAPARWESLGPGNIGGRTRVLLVDPRDSRNLYAAGVSGGVFKSVDEGESWAPVGDELANIAVNSLAMDPADPAVLYAGTGEGYFREEVRGTWLPLRGGGIFRTEDGGTAWQRLASTLGEDFHWVNDLAISRADPARIYAATRTGVWRSRDRGVSWARVLATDVKGGCLDLALGPAVDHDALFAACGSFEQGTVYRNVAGEGDAAWEPVLTAPDMGRTTLAISPSHPNIIYAVAASNVEIGGSPPQGLFAVFRSEEGGAAGSWEVRVSGDDPEILHRLLLTNLVALSPDCSGSDPSERIWVTMGWYCNVVAVDPLDADIVWVGGVELFRSGDGGRTWAVASAGGAPEWSPLYVHVDQHGITFHPEFDGASNRTMYVVNDGGVFRTSDARATLVPGLAGACGREEQSIVWESRNRGLGVTQFYHGAVFPGGGIWFGGTQDNGTILGREEWGPDGWKRIAGGDGGYVAVDPTDPKRIWVETQWGRIYASESGGGQFKSAAPGDDPSDEFLFVTPFTLDPHRPQRLWTGGSRLWRSDDRGTTWQRASAALGDDLVSAVSVSPHDPELVVAGTSGGRILWTRRASEVTGASVWEERAPRPGFVSSIAFDPRDADVFYATYAGFGGAHVWKSADRGNTWEEADGRDGGELPDIPVHSIVVDPRDSRRLYIGSDLGVFVTLDGGETWMAEREGMPPAVTETLVLARRGATLALYAFTHGRGVWRVELPPMARRRPVRR